MKGIYNPLGSKQFRRNLRNDSTIHEQLLWGQLRGKRFHGLRFLRQYGVGKYILDFYCPQKKFAIELDGSQHQEQNDYDRARTAFLESLEIRVFRVWNNEINTNMEGVLMGIEQKIFDLEPPLTPPSVQGGEAPRHKNPPKRRLHLSYKEKFDSEPPLTPPLRKGEKNLNKS